MKRSDARAQVLVVLAVVAVLGALPFLRGGLYPGKHEGDMMQMSDMILRMARGQWPHIDFMTPIGVLAMAPIALFAHFGAGLGHAIFLGQLLVALILFPPTIYVARSRFGGWPGWVYAIFVMVLCLALVHGETEPSVSISMHYNRWAWALVYIAVPLVMIAPQGRARPDLDGLIIGLVLAALALTKVTYFISVSPAILVGLIARRWWRTLVVAALVGLAVALFVTMLAGPAYWLAYLDDLRAVAASTIRPQPGQPLISVAAGPGFMGATLVLLAGVVVLRQAGRMTEGLMLLVLAPGLVYIVFQNFGNDPQWLILVGCLLFALRPDVGTRNGRQWDLHALGGMAAAAALVLGFPSAVNLAYSPMRHMGAETEKFLPLLPGEADILAKKDRMYGITETRGFGANDPIVASYVALADTPPDTTLNGETLPYCEEAMGFVAWFRGTADDLTAAGYGGKRLFVTDLFSSIWLFGDFPPLLRGAPWYYSGLSGLENADYVLVPLCPQSIKVRSSVLSELKDKGYSLTEVRRTSLYLLMAARKAS